MVVQRFCAMEGQQDKQPATTDVIGRRLMWVGLAVAAFVGAMWWKAADDHIPLIDGDFNSTPYLAGVVAGAALFVLGLVMQQTRR